MRTWNATSGARPSAPLPPCGFRICKQLAKHGESPAVSGKRSVTILGAGHGGLALAAHLARQGHCVSLWNRSPQRLAAMQERGGIWLSSPTFAEGYAPIAVATNNMATALAGTRLVLVAVPASSHAEVARTCAPHLRDGQAVLLLPGRTGGVLEFRRALDAAGCRARILLGEANTFPLAARTIAPAAARVFGVKSEVAAAALPAVRTSALLAAFRPLLPMLRPARSVLHTGFANLGAILHPVITLLNAERIMRGDSFDFYAEGVTVAVANVLQAADTERLRIARAYGISLPSLPAWIGQTYGHHADTVHAAVSGNPAYEGIKAPATVVHRYLLEDVPTGLIPLMELGRAAGLFTPALEELIERASRLLGSESWQQARTLDALGLDGLDATEIRAFIEGGFEPAAAEVVLANSVPIRRFSMAREWIPQLYSRKAIAWKSI
jgi:opine dehydrogenase